MSAYNKIAEEAEELRFKVLKKMGVQPPEEVAFLFNEYSHYFVLKNGEKKNALMN